MSSNNNTSVKMSDLYGSNESEDMSSFLQILLHNSSSSVVQTDSSSSINFSDNNCFFPNNNDNGGLVDHRTNNLASAFEGSEGSETPAQRSSKRSRAAEVHNMTEKRRRSRINEKLKALQNLIPNSNKTDKASMLDEAIEYLKQLQLQVQMLTLRNGLSTTHPAYSLGSLQSMLGPSAGLELDEANALFTVNRGTDLISTNQHVFMPSALETTNPGSSTQPMLPTSVAVGPTNAGFPPSFVPSTQNHYGLLNHLASSKDICRDDTISRLQLDISCTGNNSSPGVSSS